MKRSAWFYVLLIAFSSNLRSLLCNERNKVDGQNEEENHEKCSKYFKNCFDKTIKNENHGSHKRSSSCFGRMSSVEQNKPGTQWDTKEVEQLLVQKLRKHWRIRDKKLKAPRKMCSKLLQQEQGSDIHGYFSTKFVKVIQSDKVDYETHRVQLSDQNEGGKDMRLLACHCEIIKMDSDTDSDIAIELPNYDVEDEEDDLEENECHQTYVNRPSTDSIEIWYGPKVSVDRLSDSDSTITPSLDESQNLPREIPSVRRAPTPKFSRHSMSMSSSRKMTEIESPSLSSPDHETTHTNNFKFKQRPITPIFRRQTSIKFKQNEDEILPATDFNVPIEFARPSTSRLSRTGMGSNESQFSDFKQNITEPPQSLRALRTGLGSHESQFTPERRSRSFDYSKIGIPPTFNRWVINNAKEVPAANICVDSKMYISKGVGGRKSFFLYAKNLENNTFNVIGHFKL